MIGIKIKNSYWQKALLDLLKERAEIYQKNNSYSVVLTDMGQKKSSLTLKYSKGNVTIPLPFKKSALESSLLKIPSAYQNPYFSWNPISRQLESKKTSRKIQLTEKEAALVNFLSGCKKMEASKNQLLKNVWQYKDETDTHTIETTIYTLRQKLKEDADKLIISTKTGYRLFS